MPYWIYIKKGRESLEPVRQYLKKEEAEGFVEKQLEQWRLYTNERPEYQIFFGSEPVGTYN